MKSAYKSHIDYDLSEGTWSFDEQPAHYNGVPFSVHHGVVIRFSLPEREYDGPTILEWFRKNFGSRVEALREGGEVVWDGNNHAWQYRTERREREASEEREAIDELLHQEATHGDLPGREIWDAADWYLSALSYEEVADELGITATTTDEDLQTIADVERETAHNSAGDDITLEDLDAFLDRVRQHMIEDGDGE